MSALLSAGIAELISAELGVLRQFVNVLEREQTALTEGSTDSLMDLAQEKVRYAERLAALHKDRDAKLLAAGMSSGRSGMQSWRETGDLPVKVQNDLLNVIELAKESRRLNELNGRLVADRLQYNQQALNVLLTAAKQSALYGPDGQTHLGPSGRTLGSA
jgi:flagellar biosynthesis protein FlgN